MLAPHRRSAAALRLGSDLPLVAVRLRGCHRRLGRGASEASVGVEPPRGSRARSRSSAGSDLNARVERASTAVSGSI